jgi:trehalose 6-phosphate phosphatase
MAGIGATARAREEVGDLEAFFAVAARRRRLLLLDYDGTLAPFCPDRQRARPYPGVPGLLDRIAAHTRVVIVSGRAAAEVGILLGCRKRPEIWGSHGWERWLPGDPAPPTAPVPEPARLGLARALAAAAEVDGLASCERKPVGLALHWRGLEPAAAERLRRAVQPRWQRLLQASGLHMQPFDGGLELRVPGRDKGFAVATLLAENPGPVSVAYLGDDRTDEDAFTALGERGLSILVRPQWRPSAASIWLQPPTGLYALLRRWRDLPARG